jgi:DNA sulfur modification protein DndC
MQPLSEIRNFLVETRDNPEKYRQKERRNGQNVENKWGPYLIETRIEILRRILVAQKEIQKQEGVDLISHQEMMLIQYHWFRDNFFEPRVSDIYKKVYNFDLTMSRQSEKLQEELELLKESCQENPNDYSFIQDSLALQKTKMLMIRKRGLQGDIENRLNEYVKKEQSPNLKQTV